MSTPFQHSEEIDPTKQERPPPPPDRRHLPTLHRHQQPPARPIAEEDARLLRRHQLLRWIAGHGTPANVGRQRSDGRLRNGEIVFRGVGSARGRFTAPSSGPRCGAECASTHSTSDSPGWRPSAPPKYLSVSPGSRLENVRILSRAVDVCVQIHQPVRYPPACAPDRSPWKHPASPASGLAAIRPDLAVVEAAKPAPNERTRTQGGRAASAGAGEDVCSRSLFPYIESWVSCEGGEESIDASRVSVSWCWWRCCPCRDPGENEETNAMTAMLPAWKTGGSSSRLR